jgi:hypothetical protein
MDVRISPREQGDIGERSALCWLIDQGATVYLPFGHSPDVDLVAGFADRLVRVQVKTSNCLQNSRYVVTLATRGGNQSWSGLVKRFSSERCDYLFVLVGDGRRWFIPSDAVEGGSRAHARGTEVRRIRSRAGPSAERPAGPADR